MSSEIADILADVNNQNDKEVYLRDDDLGCIDAMVVTDIDTNTLSPTSLIKIKLRNGEEREVPWSSIDLKNPPKYYASSDLSKLSYLNQSAVYANLRDRFHMGKIYTYSGLFLVSINPWKKLDIYHEETLKLYRTFSNNSIRVEMEPHIYAVCQEAFSELSSSNNDQTILITGESGAGKTLNTSKVIQYFAKTDDANLDVKILKANPILEAFGNALTLKNNNSSRFGKFIRMQFSNSSLSGAYIDYYLLEKGRVSLHDPNERNFHIFYQLLKSADKDLRKQTGLRFLKDYKAVKGIYDIKGVDDVKEFQNTVDAMEILGIDKEQQLAIWKVLSAVLLFCNLEFVDQGEAADIANLEDLVTLSSILGVNYNDFESALLRPTVKAGEDQVVKTISSDYAVFTSRAMGRAIYERLFAWLVQKINSTLRQQSFEKFIGVLDIAGFEIFENNSLEQLSINLTNEKLQQFFNNRMFKLEQEIYLKEGINWNMVDFGLDLQPTIDLIEKPLGVFSILDEECLFPKATDESFIAKLKSTMNSRQADDESDKFSAIKLRPQSFRIKHYADSVEYDTREWLVKNKDPISSHLSSLLSQSSIPLIQSLFKTESDSKALDTRRRGAQFTTVTQRHVKQLNELMKELEKCTPHFVRCIIPNNEKLPDKLMAPLVMNQLKCNGVLEGIRITRLGYPSRIQFSDFCQRYQILIASKSSSKNELKNARVFSEEIVKALGIPKDSHSFGNSLLFLKSGVVAKLEELRNVKVSSIFVKIQAAIRGYKIRYTFNSFQKRKAGLQILQRNMKVFIDLQNDPWYKLVRSLKPLIPVYREERKAKAHEDEVKAMKSMYEDKINSLIESNEQEKAIFIENHTKSMESFKKKYSELETESKKIELSYIDLKQEMQYKEEFIRDLKESLESSQNEAKSHLSTLQKQKSSLESKDQLIESLNLSLEEEKKINSHLSEQLQENLRRHKSIVDSFSNDIGKMKQDLLDQEDHYSYELESKIRQINEELKKHASEKEVLVKENDTLASESQSLASRLEKSETDKKEIHRKLTEVSHERNELLDELNILKRDFSKLNSEFSILKNKHESNLNNYQENERNLNKLQRDYQELRQIKMEYNALHMKFKQLMYEKTQSENLLNNVQLQNESTEKALNIYKNELELITSKHDDIQRENSSLLQQYTSLKEEYGLSRREFQSKIDQLTEDLNEAKLKGQEYELNSLSIDETLAKAKAECSSLKEKLESRDLEYRQLLKEKNSFALSNENFERESQKKHEELSASISILSSENENLRDSLTKLSIKAKELEANNKLLQASLEGKANNLSIYENDLISLSNLLTEKKKELLETKAEKETAENSVKRLTKLIQNVKTELKDVSIKFVQKQQDHNQAINQLQSRLNQRELEHNQQYCVLLNEKKDMEQQKNSLLAQVENLSKNGDGHLKKLKELQSEVNEYENQMETFIMNENSLKEEINELRLDNESLRNRLSSVGPFEMEHNKLKKSLMIMEDEHNSIASSLKINLRAMESENAQLKSRVSEITEELSSISSKHEKLNNQYKMLNRLSKEAQQALEKEMSINEQLEKSNKDLQNANRNLQSRIDQMKEEEEQERKTFKSRCESKISLLNSFVHQLTAENQELAQSKRNIEEQLQNSMILAQNLQLQNNNYASIVQEHKQNIDHLSNLRETKKTLIDLEFKVETLTAENEQLSKQLARERETVKRLDKLKSSFRNSSQAELMIQDDEVHTLSDLVNDVLRKPDPPVPVSRTTSLR